MNEKLRVLCLDIEGGYGGSSRSLYESLRHMDRAAVDLEVWCRRDGPVHERYEALGIPCRIVPGLPKMNSLKRTSRNLFGYGKWLAEFLRWDERGKLLRTVRDHFDLVHFNHEGLFGLADWLRRHHEKAQTMHVRTLLLNNVFGRWQARRMTECNDQLVFITENERNNLERLTGRVSGGVVIYNVVTVEQNEAPRHSGVPSDNQLKIAVLSNYSYMRGIDRIVEIAEMLALRGRRDILFVVAGDMRLQGSLPGELGEIARKGGLLVDYARSRGVDDMIVFLGHVPHPEMVLQACNVLIKPTRENNPWGRDILEGLSAQKPVISIGDYSRFVETGVTGFLFAHYDSAQIADCILRLDADRDLCARIGVQAAQRVAALCDGASRARDLLEVWRAAVASRAGRKAA